MTATERFSSFDGTSVAYELAGPPEGDVVLLHHGFASTSRINWVRPGIAGALAEAGLRVLLVDARGHGESDHPHDPDAYAGGAMARDVGALLDRLGIAELRMAGYSMGSLVSLEVAAGDDRVRSLFLGGIGVDQSRPESRGAMAGSIAPALEAEHASSVSDATGRAFRNFADATRQDRLALAAVIRASGGLDPALLGSISVPALVVNGAKDTLAGDPALFAARIPCGRSLVVPGDHLSAVVTPEFREAIVAWATGGR